MSNKDILDEEKRVKKELLLKQDSLEMELDRLLNVELIKVQKARLKDLKLEKYSKYNTLIILSSTYLFALTPYIKDTLSFVMLSGFTIMSYFIVNPTLKYIGKTCNHMTIGYSNSFFESDEDLLEKEIRKVKRKIDDLDASIRNQEAVIEMYEKNQTIDKNDIVDETYNDDIKLIPITRKRVKR